MTVLTGNRLLELDIIQNGINYKADNGTIPSYGLDGCLYTFRTESPEDGKYRKVLQSFQSISFITYEAVCLPNNCVGYLFAKSTYSRKGLILVTNSPVDPGYCGRLTMRFFNSSDEPITIQLLGGLMQMIVHELTEPTDLPYNGRWQNNY